MISRRALLGAGALIACTSPAFGAQSYTAGKDFLVLQPPVQTDADKIEVIEFFAYTCPHCLKFQPVLEAWEKTLPADVVLRRCPVSWQPKYFPFSEAYYAMEALGLLDKLSMPFFESVIYQTHTYDFNSAEADILDFMVKSGVDADKWKAAIRSFGVKNKNRVAFQTWQAYHIDSTPMLGVGGRFITGPHMVGSRTAMPDALNWMIDQIRQERKKG